MKPLFNLVLTACVAGSICAQDKLKYEKVYYEEKTVETPTARYLISGAISDDEMMKAKVKVTNYTDKALVIKPEECTIADIPSKDRLFIVAPRQQEAKTIDVKGNNLRTKTSTLKMNGIYICNKVDIVVAPDVPLPPPDELMVGPFKLTLDGWDRDGKEIMIKYKVRYMGDKVGLCAAGKVMLKSPGGEFKNQKEKDRVFAFKNKEDFLVGFLFNSDSKNDNSLVWKDAFSEAIPEKTDAVNIELVMDEAKTKDKN